MLHNGGDDLLSVEEYFERESSSDDETESSQIIRAAQSIVNEVQHVDKLKRQSICSFEFLDDIAPESNSAQRPIIFGSKDRGYHRRASRTYYISNDIKRQSSSTISAKEWSHDIKEEENDSQSSGDTEIQNLTVEDKTIQDDEVVSNSNCFVSEVDTNIPTVQKRLSINLSRKRNSIARRPSRLSRSFTYTTASNNVPLRESDNNVRNSLISLKALSDKIDKISLSAEYSSSSSDSVSIANTLSIFSSVSVLDDTDETMEDDKNCNSLPAERSINKEKEKIHEHRSLKNMINCLPWKQKTRQSTENKISRCQRIETKIANIFNKKSTYETKKSLGLSKIQKIVDSTMDNFSGHEYKQNESFVEQEVQFVDLEHNEDCFIDFRKQNSITVDKRTKNKNFNMNNTRNAIKSRGKRGKRYYPNKRRLPMTGGTNSKRLNFEDVLVPQKANGPLQFITTSAFGFPLPVPTVSTAIMYEHRLPTHIESAIYRLSHLKLSNPNRPLREQVLLTNLMYAYLNLVNHTLLKRV